MNHFSPLCSQWHGQVKQLFTLLHGHQKKVLAMFVLGLVLMYVATAILPRPMAALVTDNADIVKIDFHSHTAASHDGRPGWSVEDNRAWHRDGGYDVAFITDHATVVAAERGVARNSYPAGEAVTLLLCFFPCCS